MQSFHQPKYVIYHMTSNGTCRRKLAGFELAQIPSDLYPLDMLRVAGEDAAPTAGGIYFLWRGPQLLYIGQTFNLNHRLYQHESNRMYRAQRQKVIPFDRHTYIYCEDDEFRLETEIRYIRAYLPPYNDKVV